MSEESLEQLKSAFAIWRRKKRYIREAIPEALLERTRAAAARFGASPVSKAIGLDCRRFSKEISSRPGPGKKVIPPPAYTRLVLSRPSMPADRILAELETPSGMKLRIFASTPEALGLLSSLCAGEVGR
ncbi:MAG TPA: hypothetical protein VE954_08620 [Oligoflexus sp.]|uniref:hypothetical protein n=1 Tax=Oligoflexus sp. TaxID=1971216 RepID=UPI002D43C909|nr:hypothetical protein [Oligoflexus sp.]HYX33166.1 hypothetical protein [Oligoflexus sp.]